jgi:hypothetical protein
MQTGFVPVAASRGVSSGGQITGTKEDKISGAREDKIVQAREDEILGSISQI